MSLSCSRARTSSARTSPAPSDRLPSSQRLCFALALWNERDPILKERAFGFTNSQGNHGEDVKECYLYFHSTHA